MYAQLCVVDVEKVQPQLFNVELGVRRGVLAGVDGPVVGGEGHLVDRDTHNAVFATVGICRGATCISTGPMFVRVGWVTVT